jgi:hypothetical protein
VPPLNCAVRRHPIVPKTQLQTLSVTSQVAYGSNVKHLEEMERRTRAACCFGAAVLGVALSMTSGCARTITYSLPDSFRVAELALNRDGTFRYVGHPHTLGESCSAEGDWWHSAQYIVLRTREEHEEGDGACNNFRSSDLWLKYRGGLIQVTGKFLKRQR